MVNVGAGQQAVALKGKHHRSRSSYVRAMLCSGRSITNQVLPADSFAQLEAIPAATRDATFYVRRAGLLLGAGQLDEARADLDQAQKLDPANGNADALEGDCGRGSQRQGRSAHERTDGSGTSTAVGGGAAGALVHAAGEHSARGCA